jgi:hypothetical protein
MAKSRGALVVIMFFIGAIFALSGLVFTLQGYGIVGPTSSFMFQSQTWIYQGIGILALGFAVLALAFYFKRRTNSSAITVVDQTSEDLKKNAPNA